MTISQDEGVQAMTSQRRLFYGWIVVATSAVGLFLGAFPIVVFSFGVFFDSFAREFHATRAAVSLAFTMHNLLSGIFAVVIGRFVDRIGARRVILPGLVVLAMMLLASKAIGSSVSELYAIQAERGRDHAAWMNLLPKSSRTASHPPPLAKESGARLRG